MGRTLLAAAWWCVLTSGASTAAGEKDFLIGYLELDGDPRYLDRATRSRLRGQPWGRPFAGARMALKEGRFAAAAAGVRLKLERESAEGTGDLVAALEKLYADGARFFLIDAPGHAVAAIAESSRDQELLLFNISALDDALRVAQCQPHLLHVVPSRAMLMDALAQYLVAKKWQEVLVPDWWHWGWERHGAPQPNGRFQKRAKRLMTGYDWAGWMAVKAIVEALLRTRSTDFATLDEFIRGQEIVLDGFKGNRLSFRPWSGQLRQPVFVTTGEWVVARAPLEGFLHAKNELDTLGMDERESVCRH